MTDAASTIAKLRPLALAVERLEEMREAGILTRIAFGRVHSKTWNGWRIEWNRARPDGLFYKNDYADADTLPAAVEAVYEAWQKEQAHERAE